MITIDDFTLDDLKRDPNLVVGRTARACPRAGSKTDRRFLKGPIPIAWLTAASSLPGKSLEVGLWLWFTHGLSRTTTATTTAKFSIKSLEEWGVSRSAAYRALTFLECADLVVVRRDAGHKARVTLIRPGSRDRRLFEEG